MNRFRVLRSGVVLALLVLSWMVPGLLGHAPWKPDEAYSFGVVYDMAHSGDVVVPTLAGEPFLEKPPLYYASAAALLRTLSPPLSPPDAARLTSACYALLTLLFVCLAARELWGAGAAPARVAILLLLGTPGFLIHAHQLITDMALLAGIAAALYGLSLVPRRHLLGGFWLGTGTGAGFLAKGLIAPGLIGPLCLLLPLAFRAWRRREYGLALLVAAASATPWLVIWPVALYERSPALFRQWFWVNNLGRYFGFVHLGPVYERGIYLETLPWFAWPAFPLALWTLWCRRRGALRAPAIQLTVGSLAVMLTVLSLAGDARELYALPMLIPLTLLGIPDVDRVPRALVHGATVFSALFFGLLAAALWAAWVVSVSGTPPLAAQWLRSLQPGYVPAFHAVGLAGAIAVTAAWVVLSAALRRGPGAAVAPWTLGLMLVWGLAMTLWLPAIDAQKSYRSMIAGLQRALPPGHGCVASLGLGEPQRAMLEYYAGLRTQRFEVSRTPPACRLILIQGTSPPPGGNAAWRVQWHGARPGDRNERFRLLERVAGGTTGPAPAKKP